MENKKQKSQDENPLGILNNCQICGKPSLETIINLDHQPPCDLLPNAQEVKEEEIHYPINVVRCISCGLVQLDFVPPPQIVFHKKYPYRTGITQMLVDNFKILAESTIKKFKLKQGSLIVDIGSNDGTALQQFKNEGMKVVGIEPTDVAKIAQENGIPTINKFFSEKVAEEVVKKYGQASVVIATNVFAHINNLSSFMRGLDTLLPKKGVFISESQYLLDTIQKAQYDTMYHEHLRFYSLKPLQVLFKKFGLPNSLPSEQTKNFLIPTSKPSTSVLNSFIGSSVGTFSQENIAYHSSPSFFIVKVFIFPSISLCFFILIIPTLEIYNLSPTISCWYCGKVIDL